MIDTIHCLNNDQFRYGLIMYFLPSSRLVFVLAGLVCGSTCLPASPVTLNLLPGSVFVSLLGENGGFCSGTDMSSNGSTSCAKGLDVALARISPSFQVEARAHFGEFTPISPNSSVIAVAMATLPVAIDGGTGDGFFEIQIDSVFSNPVKGSAGIATAGGTLVNGTFRDGYNAVIEFQYGTAFSLSFNVTTNADAVSPFSSISVTLQKYRLLRNFPCVDQACTDVPVPFNTPEPGTFYPGGAVIIAILLRRRNTTISH